MSIFRLDESRKANDLSGRNAMDKLKKVKKSPIVESKQEMRLSNEDLAVKVEVMLNEQKRELMKELEKNKAEFLRVNLDRPKAKRVRKGKEENNGEE